MDSVLGSAKKRKRSTDQGFNSRSSTNRPPFSQASKLSEPIPSPSSAAHTKDPRLPDPHAAGALADDLNQSLSRSDTNASAATTWDPTLTISNSTDASLSGFSGDPERLLLSDQDIHLLDFPDTPPVTSGGSCELYIAVHHPSGMRLAMKRPRVEFPTEDTLRRFRREAEIWSTFRHRNILPFFGPIKTTHRLYIISPWMLLGDLLAFVQARLKLIQQGEWLSDASIPDVCRSFNETRIIREIVAGLAYLHSMGVVHGDMKAKNVLLDDKGSPQICDFGLTKTLDHSVTSTELKGVGSIRWQAPEILQNVPKSLKSDIYALGMTISEILGGDYPFANLKEQTAVLFAVVVRNERPTLEPLSRLEVDFKPLWKLAAWCWETEAEDRPLAEDVIERFRSLEPSDRPNIIDPYRTSPPQRVASAPNPGEPKNQALGELYLQVVSNTPTSPPMHRLTYRILQSILLLAYSEETRGSKPSLAVTLSHVCRSWRAAATGLPSLWSTLVFNGPAPFKQQSLQLERSKAADITIRIWNDYDVAGTIQLIRLLRPHVARWRSLEMLPQFNTESYQVFFDKLRHEHARVLETLQVANHGESPGWKFQPFSWSAPRLVYMNIGPGQLNGDTTLFGRLAELWIDQGDSPVSHHLLTTRELLSVFTQCAPTIRLINIRVPWHGCIHPSGDLRSPFTLPQLQDMSLFDPSNMSPHLPSWVFEIYGQIVAPKVQEHDLDISILAYLASLAIFPFPNMSELTISQHSGGYASKTEIPDLAFVHVFSQLQQLQDLTVLDVPQFNHQILADTCSSLQRLSLSCDLISTPRLYGIKDMVERRQARAKRMGTKDTLVHIGLDGFLLSEEESVWLKDTFSPT